MRLGTFALATLLGVGLLAGCSDDEKPDAGPTGPPTSSSSSSGSTGPASPDGGASSEAPPAGTTVQRPAYSLSVDGAWQVDDVTGDANDLWAVIEGDPLANLAITELPLEPMPTLDKLVPLGKNLMSGATRVERTPDGSVAGEPAFGFEGRANGYSRIVIGASHKGSFFTIALDHPGTPAEARTAMTAMLASWRWR
ncbi:hypothetical protein ACLM5J_08775 [Nocardioides sp. Bht2]|uniref:hypothetical protein n=1 Tax=Nocardioides sp. Bht2 TaxID=3392297 RepID=UPI0039B3AA73